MPKREGTVQFMLSFADALRANGEQVRVFAPRGVCDDARDVVPYELVTLADVAVPRSEKVGGIVSDVESCGPSRVVFTDEGRGCLAVLDGLAGRVPTTLVCHDPTPHPTRLAGSLRERVSRAFYERQRRRSFGKASDYLLLSENSAATFRRVNPSLANQARVMPLCPHPPVGVCGKRPDALPASGLEGGFYLFFGCIDKYKGLASLLRAYSRTERELPLVVAGSGELSAEEDALVRANDQVSLVHGYVDDAALVWLFEHCRAVVLPYIEASQSGVLAMAYNFDKPVIVSDLPGLTEFVTDGETGFVFQTEDQLSDLLGELGDGARCRSMAGAVCAYRLEHLNWATNVRRWLAREDGAARG